MILHYEFQTDIDGYNDFDYEIGSIEYLDCLSELLASEYDIGIDSARNIIIDFDIEDSVDEYFHDDIQTYFENDAYTLYKDNKKVYYD